MKKKVIVFGCGAQARYVIDNLQSQRLSLPYALVDVEGESQVGKMANKVLVRWSYQKALDILKPDSYKAIIAHGNNKLKMQISNELKKRGFSFVKAIHKHTTISSTASIGEGCIINADVVVLPNAVIKNQVIIHSGSVVEHDCIIDDGANIAPGVHLAGRVKIGKEAYIYSGSCIIPKIEVGDNAIVGAGAVVIRNVPGGVIVAGNPARIINKNKE